MIITRNNLFGSLLPASTLIFFGNGAAFSQALGNSVLNGTYAVSEAYGPSEYTLTFDGNGNHSGTVTVSSEDSGGALITCTSAESGTYTVAAEGGVSIVYSVPACGVSSALAGQTATGMLSVDGNSFLVTDYNAASELDQLFGVKEPQNAESGNYSSGLYALYQNTTGADNTATGTSALTANTSGSNNSAYGWDTLQNNTTGNSNAAIGSSALAANTTGANNTAFGANALWSNTVGKGNAGQGSNALYSNTTGIRNLGIGSNALYGNVSGSYNIAMGFDAGYDQTTGNDTIYIANMGVAGESQTLRLGTQGTSGVVGSGILTTYIAGVATSQVTGSAVYVTSSGQLGVLASSERYKTDIAPLLSDTERLMQLRPVTFHLKTEPRGALQYGLIAEEVEALFPELVVRDDSGKIQGVRYDELAPILLSQVQEQQRKMALQTEELALQKQRLAAEDEQLAALNAKLTAKALKDAARDSELSALHKEFVQLLETSSRVAAAGQPSPR
jgi:hypothetical protein